jgi:hypothetical protein
MQTNTVYPVQVYNPVDSIQEYTQRADKLTLSAGNAQEVNSRIQVIDPWPRYVGNTRIVANGERMADAVYRYRCGKPAPPPLQPVSTSTTTTSGSQGSVAAPASVGRPGTDCSGGVLSNRGTRRFITQSA